MKHVKSDKGVGHNSDNTTLCSVVERRRYLVRPPKSHARSGCVVVYEWKAWMSSLEAVEAPIRRHRNVPKRNRDSQITGVILAFAERLLLAINGH